MFSEIYQWLCCAPLVLALLWWIYLAAFRRDEFIGGRTDPAVMRQNVEKAVRTARAGVNAAQGWLKR